MKGDINEVSEDESNHDLATAPQGSITSWTSTNFARPDMNQIKRSRFTYVNGLFKPENGPYLLENAFQNEDNATLNAVCTEIARIMKDDQEAQYVPYARTCICCIVPSDFKPQLDLLRQGNYYQYDLMGRYLFICKTTWHNNHSHKK